MNITVATREQAWQEAKKLFPMEYEKDYASSVRSGHPIYTHMSSTHHCRIDELDGRLIVYIGQYDNISNDYSGLVTNIRIKENEPGVISDIGTNMSQSAYDELCGNVKQWEITDEEAILYINNEFGFEASRIVIVSEVETFINDNGDIKINRQYIRSPQYRVSDYNYVRFDVNSWHYEIINGRLYQYRD